MVAMVKPVRLSKNQERVMAKIANSQNPANAASDITVSGKFVAAARLLRNYGYIDLEEVNNVIIGASLTDEGQQLMDDTGIASRASDLAVQDDEGQSLSVESYLLREINSIV